LFIDCSCLGGNERFAYIGLFDGYHGKAASSLCREHIHDAILYDMGKLHSDMNHADVEQTLINRLYKRLVDPLNSTHANVDNVDDVFCLAYSKMDHLLSRGIHETSDVRWSGTSALTAVLVANDRINELIKNLENNTDDDTMSTTFGHIHVANCGR
jgi:serine/threonine protein phosphatase PrpC